jgi:hypothetical protein
VTLDGKPLPSNPFAGVLPLDTAAHVLNATADGYKPLAHDLRLDADIDVDLTLVPVALPGRPGRPAPNNGAGSAQAPRRPARPVDEKDPYAQ